MELTPRARCVWCQRQHETNLLLCPECEEQAKDLKARRGEPIR